jgi:hypothetical protein
MGFVLAVFTWAYVTGQVPIDRQFRAWDVGLGMDREKEL